MSDWTPGPGWREVHHDEETDGRRTVREYDEHGMTEHVWVREDPVPSLPTEPYTVIRVKWRYPFPHGGIDVLALGQYERGKWGRWSPAEVTANITDFEVLAEPRAVTAKAVLDRVRESSLIQLVIAANPRNWDAMNDVNDLILLCAFRYALGRRTYVVAAVAEEIRRRNHALRENDRQLIMREIEDALKDDRVGMAMDRDEWIRTHATLAAGALP